MRFTRAIFLGSVPLILSCQKKNPPTVPTAQESSQERIAPVLTKAMLYEQELHFTQYPLAFPSPPTETFSWDFSEKFSASYDFSQQTKSVMVQDLTAKDTPSTAQEIKEILCGGRPGTADIFQSEKETKEEKGGEDEVSSSDDASNCSNQITRCP